MATPSHVPEPEAAGAEMLRITRPGGRVAIIDVDIEGTIIDSSDHELVRLAAVAGADRLQNGRIARHLETMLRSEGVSSVATHPMFARMTLEVLKAMFAEVLQQRSTAGPFDTARVQRWWAALTEQDSCGRLFSLLPVIVVVGTVR